MKRLPFLLIALIFTCFIFNGCNNNLCPLTTVALAHFDFLDGATHKQVTMTGDAVITGFTRADVTVYDTINGIAVPRIVKDSLLNDTLFNKPTTSMSLPLSYNTSTTYVIHYTNSMRDTIMLQYSNIPFLDNIDCGTIMFHKVNSISYTTHVLDSITIVNKDISNEEKSNFNIYYTATE